jgi:hypothetical protein
VFTTRSYFSSFLHNKAGHQRPIILRGEEIFDIWETFFNIPNFGFKFFFKKNKKNLMPHPGFEKALMRNRDFF